MVGLDVTADKLQGFKTTENITANILDDPQKKKKNDLKKKLENGKRFKIVIWTSLFQWYFCQHPLYLMLCTTTVSFAYIKTLSQLLEITQSSQYNK